MKKREREKKRRKKRVWVVRRVVGWVLVELIGEGERSRESREYLKGKIGMVVCPIKLHTHHTQLYSTTTYCD